MNKIWEYKNASLPAGKAEAAAKALSLPKTVVTILFNRGIAENEIEAFLKKSLSGVINPKLLPDSEKAVKRIIDAVNKKEKITIYGDYDVDGITSTALMYDFLKALGADVEYYIPDRKDEGYGINIMAVNRLLKSGTKLLITVDCGITAVGEVEFAKLQHMDVIITDHHTCKDRLPESAAAIINPKIPDCGYPFDALAGVGVAFKLVLAIAMAKGINTTACFNRYADLAAIGTVADVVSLTGENRIIVNRGLKLMQEPKRPGLRALFEAAGIAGKPVTSTTVSFAIAPRLNAAGRIGTAKTSVELLLTNDETRAKEIAQELDETNTERQETERAILDDALDMISTDKDFSKKRVIVLAKKGWHSGVIGIVASKLMDKYYKPCILISLDDSGTGKGSGRSISAFNLFDALTACESELIEFGGHSAAAGLSINSVNIGAFSAAINKYAETVMTDADLTPKLRLDCELTASDLTLTNAKLIEKLEPFGMGNEKPLFSVANMTVASIFPIGNEGKHLRLRFKKDNVYVSAIGFGIGKYAESINEGDKLDIAFELNVNRYMGQESVQLIIRDLKRSGKSK